MDITFFLAKVLGWYLVITGFYLFFNYEGIKTIIRDILADKALMFFIALITLISGLLLVVSHNVWLMGWPVIVTIISWLVLISGIFRLCAPELNRKFGQWWLSRPASSFIITALICLLVGLYLLYRAYFV